jgi:Fur family ferric uptake transcriptional regulator
MARVHALFRVQGHASARSWQVFGVVMESQDLRKAGLKVTHPRMRILQLLEQTKPRHMTAEDIYRQLLGDGEEIGLATIYRVLTQFESAGLVLKHNFEGGHAVYELDRGEHHDHMVDVDTGKVIEFQSEAIEALQHEIAAEQGYAIEDHALVLYVRKKR